MKWFAKSIKGSFTLDESEVEVTENFNVLFVLSWVHGRRICSLTLWVNTHSGFFTLRNGDVALMLLQYRMIKIKNIHVHMTFPSAWRVPWIVNKECSCFMFLLPVSFLWFLAFLYRPPMIRLKTALSVNWKICFTFLAMTISSNWELPKRGNGKLSWESKPKE